MFYILSVCITVAAIWTGNLEWLTPAAIFAVAGGLGFVGGQIEKITMVDVDDSESEHKKNREDYDVFGKKFDE